MQTITENELKVLISLIKSAIRSAVADAGTAADAKVKVVSDRLDRLVDGSASEAIDTFNEIEAFLRGLTDSDSLTGLLQQLRTGLEAQISTKVDKVDGKGLSANDYTDADRETVEAVADERRQFNTAGYRHSATGILFTESDSYFNSGFVLINRDYPIVVNGMGTTNIAAIALYDSGGNFIKDFPYPNFSKHLITCNTESIPDNAVFFSASSTVFSGAYWQNGPTREARENAITSAVAPLKAWHNTQFHIRGIIDKNYGNVTESAASGWRVTDFLPLNRRNPIVCSLFTDTAGFGGVAFYDAAQTFLAFVHTPSLKETTIPISDFPAGATYFRANTVASADAWYSNGSTQEARESAVSEAIISSKELLFIDEWVMAWGPLGGYDAKATDGHPYLGNGLRMTYKEALKVWEYRWNPPYLTPIDNTGIYTNLLLDNTLGIFDHQPVVDRLIRDNITRVLRISRNETYGLTPPSNTTYPMIITAVALTTILGVLNAQYLPNGYLPVQSAERLTTFKIQNLARNINLGPLKSLSCDSVSYMVTNALNNASGIVVTVHPDVYAKLTDTANTEWYAVLEAAMAKNITFATTD